MDLAPVNATYALAEVYETDVAQLRLGQRAIIEASALTGPLTGSIARISSSVERQQTVNTDPAANTDARVVRVYVAIDPKQAAAARRLLNLQVTVRFL